jgi:hypothetical protein
MAQAKRRRQTKHRGNAAGVVESRGRTGRKPTVAEKSVSGRDAALAKEKRSQRYDRPPTWRGAFWRALAAAVAMAAITTFLTHKTAQAVAIFPVVLLLYIPISFYTDQWMYRRRMRTKAARGRDSKAVSR